MRYSLHRPMNRLRDDVTYRPSTGESVILPMFGASLDWVIRPIDLCDARGSTATAPEAQLSPSGSFHRGAVLPSARSGARPLVTSAGAAKDDAVDHRHPCRGHAGFPPVRVRRASGTSDTPAAAANAPSAVVVEPAARTNPAPVEPTRNPPFDAALIPAFADANKRGSATISQSNVPETDSYTAPPLPVQICRRWQGTHARRTRR